MFDHIAIVFIKKKKKKNNEYRLSNCISYTFIWENLFV